MYSSYSQFPKHIHKLNQNMFNPINQLLFDLNYFNFFLIVSKKKKKKKKKKIKFNFFYSFL